MADWMIEPFSKPCSISFSIFALEGYAFFVERMLLPRALPVVIAGLLCFAASAWAVFQRHFVLARLLAALEIGMLILGWGLAQHPDLLFVETAAPRQILQFLVYTFPVGALLLGPSLYYLLRVFKS